MPVRAYQTSNACTAGTKRIRVEGLGFRVEGLGVRRWDAFVLFVAGLWRHFFVWGRFGNFGVWRKKGKR